MSRSFIHHCVAYLLIALLPLQAAAAGRLALCAENAMGMAKNDMTKADMATNDVQTMEHCSQMTSMQQPLSSGLTKMHGNASCWLGSICIASFGMMAVPSTYRFVPLQHSAPSYFFPATHYLSVIRDTPQRPPTTIL